MNKMDKIKLQPLKGFRDFLPVEASTRLWLKNRLTEIVEKWGYLPLETPTLEPLELFSGNIGEDEKLFYKFQDLGGRDVALRYDQTVPTCRVVSQYKDRLAFPFKRYQFQPSFRAEKPQAGRYREFYQFDFDIFGSCSEYADAECIALTLEIYLKLGFQNAVVSINDRELLADIPYIAIVALDKLEKIGSDAVLAEMKAKGISEADATTYLERVRDLKPNQKLENIFKYLKSAGFSENNFRFDPLLARAFSYSTGPIWEVKIPDFEKGSVGGGERYDELVEKISGDKIPGTGFAVGFDRTLEAMEQFNLIPDLNSRNSVLVTIFSPEQMESSLKLSLTFREQGITTELYPDPQTTLDKQLKYADKKGIPYVVIIGPDEAEKNLITLKNLNTKEQKTISSEEAINIVRNDQ